jgi:Arc/MetJ family transcription regulator
MPDRGFGGSIVMKSTNLRTNIVLDSRLVEAGLKATGLKTRRELVDYALRELLRHKQQRKLLALKGRVTWEGNLEDMRAGSAP